MYSYVKHTDGHAMPIATLYKQYYTMLHGYLLKRSGSKQLAEDTVQQVFLMVLEKGIAVEAMENPKAFLLTLLRNEWINYLRREQLQRQMMKDTMWRNQKVSSHDQLLEKEYKKTLHAAIERLPVQQKKVYQLSFELGMKNDEIAEVMEISMCTVKCHLQKARNEVRGWIRRVA